MRLFGTLAAFMGIAAVIAAPTQSVNSIGSVAASSELVQRTDSRLASSNDMANKRELERFNQWPVPADDAACIYTSDIKTSSKAVYGVHVGRPYLKGTGCPSIRATLEKYVGVGNVTDYDCYADTWDNTILWFTSGDYEDKHANYKVIDGLAHAYPDVPFVQHQICDYGATPKPGPENEPQHPKRGDEDPISANTATCVYDYVRDTAASIASYDIHIGRPFIGGAGCQPIHDTILTALHQLSVYNCDPDQFDNTILKFATGTYGDRFANYKVIDALQEAYPDVPFQKDRICLERGAPVPEYWPS